MGAPLSCKTDETYKYDTVVYVKSASATVYKRPDIFSETLSTLTFGSKVQGLNEKYRYGVPIDWRKVLLSSGEEGYIEQKYLADGAFMGRIGQLLDTISSMEPQGEGELKQKARLYIEPSDSSPLIDIVNPLSHVIIYKKVSSPTGEGNIATADKSGVKKWYLVKTDKGLAGYIPTKNVRLTPPDEISVYTSVRNAVAWQKIPVERGEGEGRDYVVSYLGTKAPEGADFDRIEVYRYDAQSKRYATVLAKSGLYGLLPLSVAKLDGGVIIKARVMNKKDGRVYIQEYSYPPPVRLIREYSEE